MGTIFDLSGTAGSNTTIDGTNIAEGCPAGNVNNVIRSLAAFCRNTFSSTLQTFLVGSSPLAITSGGTGATTAPAALTALGINSAGFVPTGAVFAFAMNTAPTGWLGCNGAAVSRTTYATLFAAIGLSFGAGDGSTTFNLPDLRGEFIRGWDNSRGVDVSRAFASAQSAMVGPHNHTLSLNTRAGNNATTNPSPGWGGDDAQTGPFTATTANNSGTDTRPRNIALFYAIKT
jgi:microcystin-dependent protein